MGEAAELADVLRALTTVDESTPAGKTRAAALRKRQRELMAPHTKCGLLDLTHNGTRLVVLVLGIGLEAMR